MLDNNDIALLNRIIDEWQRGETSRNCSRDYYMEDRIVELKNKLAEEAQPNPYGLNLYGQPNNSYANFYSPKRQEPERFGF